MHHVACTGQCVVNVTVTLEEQCIHIEQLENPKSLIFVVEGEELSDGARLAWRYMRQHPERPAGLLRLRMQGPMPLRRLHQTHRVMTWLARKIYGLRVQ